MRVPVGRLDQRLGLWLVCRDGGSGRLPILEFYRFVSVHLNIITSGGMQSTYMYS